MAGVEVVKTGKGTPGWTCHDADIFFAFVMEGTVTLSGKGEADQVLTAGDAFVVPPGMATMLSNPSQDFEMLEVSLPGVFDTVDCAR